MWSWLARRLGVVQMPAHDPAAKQALELRVAELEEHVDWLHGSLRKLRVVSPVACAVTLKRNRTTRARRRGGETRRPSSSSGSEVGCELPRHGRLRRRV